MEKFAWIVLGTEDYIALVLLSLVILSAISGLLFFVLKLFQRYTNTKRKDVPNKRLLRISLLIVFGITSLLLLYEVVTTMRTDSYTKKKYEFCRQYGEGTPAERDCLGSYESKKK